jgi:hypothetical protein
MSSSLAAVYLLDDLYHGIAFQMALQNLAKEDAGETTDDPKLRVDEV